MQAKSKICFHNLDKVSCISVKPTKKHPIIAPFSFKSKFINRLWPQIFKLRTKLQLFRIKSSNSLKSAILIQISLYREAFEKLPLYHDIMLINQTHEFYHLQFDMWLEGLHTSMVKSSFEYYTKQISMIQLIWTTTVLFSPYGTFICTFRLLPVNSNLQFIDKLSNTLQSLPNFWHQISKFAFLEPL